MNVFILLLSLTYVQRSYSFSISPRSYIVSPSSKVPINAVNTDPKWRHSVVPPFETAESRWGYKSARSFRSRRRIRELLNRDSLTDLDNSLYVHPRGQAGEDPASNINVISSHSVMDLNVISGPDGHKIMIKPKRIGHIIQIGSKNVKTHPLHVHPNTQSAESTDTPDYYNLEDTDRITSEKNEAVSYDGDCEPFCASKDDESSETPEILFEQSTSNSQNPSNFEEADYFSYSKSQGSYSSTKPPEIDTFDAEGSGDTMFRNIIDDANSAEFRNVKARLISLFSERNGTVACTTPKNEPGHCRPLRQCFLQDVLTNLNSYLQYMCFMPSRMVGICCPDNPVVEITNTESWNTTEEEILPTQPADGCGFNSRTRIVGGDISKPHEWTWMVALLKRNRFFCGGALINNLYVLTAAHCTLGINVNDLTIRLGEYNFNNRTKHQQDIQVAEIKRHAQFTTLTFKHDIALLKLRHPVKYSRVVGTICLPKEGNKFAHVNATVAGWGTVSFGGAASPVLRQVTIQVWNNTECDRTYAMEDIDDSFLCAGSDEAKDACQGDSGGPLMTLNDQGRWEVIGLVSWGKRCGDPMFPGVYTRVTTYLDWIQKNSQQ